MAGYADLIADLSATGTTLKENRLKTLDDGTVLSSQACLVANAEALASSPGPRELARGLTEMMEAHMRSEPFYRLSANVQGDSAEAVSAMVLARPALAGLRGPTVARVYNVEEKGWFSVSLLVQKEHLLAAVDHLRDCGAVDVAASQLSYLFDSHSNAYEELFGT